MSHKGQLLERMRAEGAQLDEVVRSLDGRLDEDLGDGWRVRDVLAHLALWERIAVRKITGVPLADGVEIVAVEPWDLDRFNETMRARWQSRSEADVLRELAAAHQALTAAVEGANEHDCAPGGSVHQAIEEDGAGHYQGHLPALRALLSRPPGTSR